MPPVGDSCASPATSNGRASTSVETAAPISWLHLGDCCCRRHSLLCHAENFGVHPRRQPHLYAKIECAGRSDSMLSASLPHLTTAERRHEGTEKYTPISWPETCEKAGHPPNTLLESLGHIEHLFSLAPQYPHAKVLRRALIRSQSIGQAIYRRCRSVLLVKNFPAKAVMAAYGSEIPSTDTRRSPAGALDEQTCHPFGVPGLVAHFAVQSFPSLSPSGPVYCM